jgi:hypothetical protein
MKARLEIKNQKRRRMNEGQNRGRIAQERRLKRVWGAVIAKT